MSSSIRRVVLSGIILSCGLGAQAGLEKMIVTTRPALRGSLESIPTVLGTWVGHDVPVSEDIKNQSQATEFLNRVYENEREPGQQLSLWINFSIQGDNLRHSPEICLPSTGYNKVESECHVIRVQAPDGTELPISRLGYDNGELFQSVGFWYYIFGEGRLENYVRRLPITSRSSHGRTTRGSSLTVEVFAQGATAVDEDALKNFSSALLKSLEPVLPTERAEYYVP